MDQDATGGLWSDGPDARLLGSRNLETGELLFPPLPRHAPLAARHALQAMASVGSLYSFTIIHPSPKSGVPPYALGYVDFEDGAGSVRIFGRLIGEGRPSIGQRYQAVPDATWGYVFETSPTHSEAA